jgi:hypothetical protein
MMARSLGSCPPMRLHRLTATELADVLAGPEPADELCDPAGSAVVVDLEVANTSADREPPRRSPPSPASSSGRRPPRVGRQRTAWLALTGRAIDAAMAPDWGLVDTIDGRDEAP